MKIPKADLTPSKVEYMNEHRCVHGNTYLEHYACYRDKRYGSEPRIGFFDIEASDLKSDFGIVYSYCILDNATDKILCDVIKDTDFHRQGNDQADKRVVGNMIKDLRKFTHIIGHYSSMYDLKFIRTNAVMLGLGDVFPKHGEIFQYDTIKGLWSKFCLTKNGLEHASRNLIGKTRKTHLTKDMRFSIIRGEKWAQDMCLDHNRKDVLDTRDLFNVIKPFIRLTKTSI